ncbi:hypothetical protein [Lewinella cohaerens]|uniref:hypothetical protein n=1 Tax=Lewinella cohaerens TaxID=70995 RepID=UPI00039A840F|nr:hypothetical protein [Lewinella cohaerens]
MKKVLFLLMLFFTLNNHVIYSQSNIMEDHNMVKIYESEIGVYYSQVNELDKIVKLDSFLTTRTDSISDILNHRISGKVQFEFYPTQALAEFVCGWDTTNTQRGLHRIGCAHYINKIQLVVPGSSKTSDNNYTNWGGANKVVLHEYIHSLTYSIVGEDRINKIPFLFTEGIALYLSQQIYLNTLFREIIYDKIEENQVPKFQKLIINKKFIKTSNSYHWAFLFINYIVDEYGWDTLLMVQEDFEKYNEIIGLNDSKINEGWFNYLESIKVEPK